MAGALDCYQRAVAQYKLAGHWKLAGETLSRMGDIYRKQADHMGAGRLYGEAGNCYRKCSATAAVASYSKVTRSYWLLLHHLSCAIKTQLKARNDPEEGLLSFDAFMAQKN